MCIAFSNELELGGSFSELEVGGSFSEFKVGKILKNVLLAMRTTFLRKLEADEADSMIETGSIVKSVPLLMSRITPSQCLHESVIC
jgi:hypothetical protein